MGTRGSELAMAQTELALSVLSHSGIEEKMDVQIIRTSGDSGTSKPAEGSFVDTINDRVIDGRLDIGVHSMKDLPAILPPEIEIAMVPKRASRHDCLVGPATLYRLSSGTTVGTSSPRRIAQLARIRPDLRVVQMRGNVTTRIARLSTGKAGSALLALAGLERLGIHPSDGMGIYPLPLDHFVPAAGQGAIALVCRKGYFTEAVKKAASDRQTLGETGIERALLLGLGAGCSVPLGISVVSFGRGYTVRLQLLSPDGSKEAKLTARVSADDGVNGILSSFERLRASRFGQ
ncbi:MAG: hydroxymethylbilane synthase [Thermoplasmata archaeon]|nr:hydroxymethylbilane synthase [Candidatus Sysuiplasma acidicola]